VSKYVLQLFLKTDRENEKW